ncbi:uncharacterized protein LOC121935535 isoform X2 [Sceloporus undulatus]|nr:uncharacterized protein LOC121935535 isoform X2 [Sceloporus undulatus]
MKARRREPRRRKGPLRCVERPQKRMHPREEILRLRHFRRLSSCLYEMLQAIVDDRKTMATLVALLKTTHLYDKINKEKMQHQAKERMARKRKRGEGMQLCLQCLRKNREPDGSPPCKIARSEEQQWPEDVEMMSIRSETEGSLPEIDSGDESQGPTDSPSGSGPFRDGEERQEEEEKEENSNSSDGSLDNTHSTAVEDSGDGAQQLPPANFQDHISLRKIAGNISQGLLVYPCKLWQGILWLLKKVAQKLQSGYQKWAKIAEKKEAPVQTERRGTSQDLSVHQLRFPPCYHRNRCSRYKPYN